MQRMEALPYSPQYRAVSFPAAQKIHMRHSLSRQLLMPSFSIDQSRPASLAVVHASLGVSVTRDNGVPIL